MRTITSMSLHGNKQIIRRGLVQGLKSRPNKQQGISRELRLSIKDSFHQNNILTAGRERCTWWTRARGPGMWGWPSEANEAAPGGPTPASTFPVQSLFLRSVGEAQSY